MVKKVFGGILALVGLGLLGLIVSAVIRHGVVNLGTIAICATGLAAIVLGVKMVRESKKGEKKSSTPARGSRP